MVNDESEGNPLTIAKELIQLITWSIANVYETKSLSLMDSISELDFELNMALLEFGKNQYPSHDYERLCPLLEVLATLVGDGQHKRHYLKAKDLCQQLQAVLSRASAHKRESQKLSLIQLPQTTKELRDMGQKVKAFRRDHLSDTSDPGLCQGFTDKSHEMASSQGRYEPNVQEKKKQAAEDFMRQGRQFYRDKIDPLDPLNNKMEIRVAVLDTGVDKEDMHFRAVRGESGTCLKEVTSFIGGDHHDSNGHGTTVAAFIVEMAPHVDLFIAKVCKDREINRVDQYVEAIEWAMEREVHIINISASIDEDSRIKRAIRAAEAKNIIVIAAASENEANKTRAFPASMKKVLAIHSTDGQGRICYLNPYPLDTEPNISTLGESIRSPLNGFNDRGPLLDGVSYSTAIASGMAANILTLAHAYLDDSEDGQQPRDEVFTWDGMTNIFLNISGGPDRDGYNYVCPIRVAKHCHAREAYRRWFKSVLEQPQRVLR
ncbi:hypothetical protein H9Q72_001103 [Fusarium xylarioides]|uniref:Peptidase S8/S53 domain-containing protein n=1 Tax=Fusarium xylarioides TaxID=221167 RepID=A0A9P7LAN7_9HYPO|nr:hypothetical protein H9Q70_001226 [Fusarium xylarioides]KAG5772924.1 hypothetical protein H9Q72_001103 [Fusarium xylarioides]KAG5785111.1 hypothetical protein H9Q73_001269 [Fusarium xylarioides]